MSFGKQLFTSYSKLIASNPETCSDIELLTKYMSYFVSGKITDDNILSEGLLSFSHLLVIFNDYIIRKELNKTERTNVNDEEQKLKLFLTILENVEVFIEISSKRVLGNRRKFIVIAIIQIVKCIGRLVLILKYKNRISKSPALEYLDRKNVLKQPQNNTLQPELSKPPSMVLKLKRSGKTIKRVSPSLYSRTYNDELEEPDRFESSNHQAIKNAELLYIMKPVIHLGSIAAFGYKSWKSYLVSFLLDTISIYEYFKKRNYMSSEQKKELSRRCVNMLLYILRSPFYDQYSNDKIDSFMRALNHIPFARFIVEPYRQYIPTFQKTYFYMFSN
ncbi:peroxisomal membrane protein PEX16 [Chironomus tepperi]|uniref:peroxisomal membrane protein PEX16 n=1 Tax=Chironomus tepperi TaxID=113505 RepID=UPI00391EE22B